MKASWAHRIGAVMVVLLLSASNALAAGTQLLVSNVQAQQRQFTAMWDVTYDLETVGDIAVTVSLSLSTDSGTTYPNVCATVSGDIGVGVPPGTGKHIVWDAGADFPGLSRPTCRLRVTADDGQSVIPAGFVSIAPGTFMMGSPTTELTRQSDETRHQVTLTHGLYIQATEVTHRQYCDMVQWAYDHGYATADEFGIYDNLDGSTDELLDLEIYNGNEILFDGSTFTVASGNDAYPVRALTWYGSVAYCDWLSLQQGLPRAYNHSTWQCVGSGPYSATGYRLPTEAEWEYACRAGTQTPFNTGSCLNAATEANFNGGAAYPGCTAGPDIGTTVPVASYPANPLGLNDMHGNVSEWCNDWYGTYSGTVTNPGGPGAGTGHVVRGGSYFSYAQYCRSAIRGRVTPDASSAMIGFRPVRLAD